jgi:hypothetical protein
MGTYRNLACALMAVFLVGSTARVQGQELLKAIEPGTGEKPAFGRLVPA